MRTVASIMAAPSPRTATASSPGQRRRSVAIALALGALVVVFYAATIIHLGPNALNKAAYNRPDGGKGAASTSVPIKDRAVPEAVRGAPPDCKQAKTC